MPRSLPVLLWTLLGCGKSVAPPPPAAQELIVAARKAPNASAELYDLELRQRVDLFEEIRQAPGVDRLKILETGELLLGDKPSLETLRTLLRGELSADRAAMLLRTDCEWGAPDPQDLGRFELPEPKAEMGQKVGQFLFDTRKEIGFIVPYRIRCKDGTGLWLQLVKRKGEGKPVRLLRVGA